MVLFRNNFLISRSVPFGRNYSLRCLLMPLHVSSIPRHATDGFEIQWHFRAFSRGKNLLFFLKKRLVRSCRISAPWSTVPVAAFTVNHRCPFKYRKRKSQKEQVPIYTSCKETWKGKKESRNHKIAQNWWSSYYDLFTEREIHTFRTWKATEMFKYSFVMIVFLYVLRNVNRICIFMWNMI